MGIVNPSEYGGDIKPSKQSTQSKNSGVKLKERKKEQCQNWYPYISNCPDSQNKQIYKIASAGTEPSKIVFETICFIGTSWQARFPITKCI